MPPSLEFIHSLYETEEKIIVTRFKLPRSAKLRYHVSGARQTVINQNANK